MDSIKEMIEKRAYHLFLKRGGLHGYSVQDWFQAEKEIFAEIESKKKAEPQAAVKPAKVEPPAPAKPAPAAAPTPAKPAAPAPVKPAAATPAPAAAKPSAKPSKKGKARG